MDPSTKQPRALYMLFFSEMWERFSFYGMRALLTLYLTTELFRDLQDPEKRETAFGIYAIYGALVYATPFIGGLIADKLLGYKKAVMFGSVMMAIGHFVMAIETQLFLYIALAFLIVGNGFFKPNISSMVGGLYGENDARRDGGFTIFYMGINLGAFLAPLTCGYLGETYGWIWGFSLAGFGMLAGLIVFGLGKDKLGENGDPPDLEKLTKPRALGLSAEYITYILAFLSVGIFALMVRNYELVEQPLVLFAIAVLGYIIWTAFRSEKEERERLFVVVLLLFFSTLFWAFFEQAGSSLTLFASENVNRTVAGKEIGASLFQSLNPFFIIALAPLFSRLWISLDKRKAEPSSPVKFSLALFQLGFGFLLLVFGAQFVSIHEITVGGQTTMAAAVPILFLVGAYFLHTTGELCISPVGLSMVTKLAPKRIGAMVMGAWFLSSTLAHQIGGKIASLTSGTVDQSRAIQLQLLDIIQQGPFGISKASAETANHLVLAANNGELEGITPETLTETVTELANTNLVFGERAIDAGLIESTSEMSQHLLRSFDQLATYNEVFVIIGYVSIGAGTFLFIISPLVRKWMHGVN